MGRWFAGLLQREGHKVHAWGRGSAAEVKARVPSCQVVVVSVPLGVTGEVIRWVGPLVKKEGLLMDLSSLKTEPMAEMLGSSSSEVLGLHPLFGPKVRSLKGKGIALCRGRGEAWLGWLKSFLKGKGAEVVELDPGEHDRAMAVVQALTHLNTMSMGLVMRSWGMGHHEISRLATPIFRKKMLMVRKVFHENPELYCSIAALNPHSGEILERYSRAVGCLCQPVQARDPEGLRQLLMGGPGKTPELTALFSNTGMCEEGCRHDSP